jgi:hypothetical protein
MKKPSVEGSGRRGKGVNCMIVEKIFNVCTVYVFSRAFEKLCEEAHEGYMKRLIAHLCTIGARNVLKCLSTEIT